MRILTLGVLIVSAGTLAALPFRRYQTVPDASSGPVQATGPTQSAVDHSRLPALAVDDAVAAPQIDEFLEQVPLHQAAAASRREHVSAPLTYDDLAVPINQPRYIRERFSATAGADAANPQPTIQALVMPRMESLAPAQRQEIESSVAVVDVRPSAEINATGAPFATASTRQHFRQDDSSDAEAQQRRHWIRQPD